MSTTYVLADLALVAGVTKRMVRYYIERRILPGPVLRGGNTAYTEEHRQRLLAIRRLRTRERLDIREIGRRLAAMSPAEIARLAEPEAAPAAQAAPAPAAAPRPASLPDAATQDPSGAAQAAAAQAAAPLPAERWDRIVLVPGLELLVRADGSPLLQRLAREIVQQYRLSAGGPEPCDDGP